MDQLWFAARAIIENRNPYLLIGPGREFEYEWQLYYPLPAALLLTPLAALPLVVVRVLLAGAGNALLAYGIARHDARGLVLFLSYAFYANAWYVQWTPWLTAMWYLPLLAMLIAIKPTTGLVMLVGTRGQRPVAYGLVLAAVLTAIAFTVQPSWAQDWWSALRTNTHLRPWVTVPGGFLLLLSLIRWRRWEAWVLATFAIIPQTFHPLATLPLILLPGTLPGKAVVAVATHVPNWLLVREPFGSRLATATAEEMIGMYGTLVHWTVLVPTLVCVLLLRNRGKAPGTIERFVRNWPTWLKGEVQDPAGH